MCEFLLREDEDTLEIAEARPIWRKDLSCISRRMWGTYVWLPQAEEELKVKNKFMYQNSIH